MATITDRQINSKPDTKDRWLNETVVRGHGVLVARITPSGSRSFYFRYTDSHGKRDRMPIGNYSRDEKPGCMTLTQARLKAKELAGLHKQGITDIRQHFEAEEQLQKAKLEAEYIKIALSTGCRIGELMTAEWSNIDLEKREWFMPTTKNGKSHTIQLSAFAVEQFQFLYEITGPSRWCFPNRHDTGALCPKTINKQLQDRQRQPDQTTLKGRSQNSQALIQPGGKWTPHDIRRTAATMMVEAGILPEGADRCLNHTEQNKIKRTYQRYSYAKEMRHAWEVLGARQAKIKVM